MRQIDRRKGCFSFNDASIGLDVLTPDSTIVSINLETGVATKIAKMDKPLPMTETPVVVDFNPVADRLRFMTGTTNHRVHPDTGAVSPTQPATDLSTRHGRHHTTSPKQRQKE